MLNENSEVMNSYPNYTGGNRRPDSLVALKMKEVTP